MENPYKLLGVEKDASTEAIKASYRRMAKKYHPDINPGDKTKEEHFKKMSAAYELLSDPKKRESYDNGKIDEMGNPIQQQPDYSHYSNTAGGQKYHQNTQFNQDELDEMLRNMFRSHAQPSSSQGFEQGNQDVHYTIEIDFMDAVHGTKKTIQIPQGKTLDIGIPKGIKEGQKLRLKGQGLIQKQGNPAGDAYISVHIRPHAFFERKGHDIYIELPITIDESILGKSVMVPTVHGLVNMHLPKGINTGTLMKLKGKGILTGDQFIKLKIVMPEKIDPELETFMQGWSNTHAYNPRKYLENIT